MKTRTSIQCLMLFVILSSPLISFAQEQAASKSRKLNGGFGHLCLSAEQFNLSDLNRSLSSHGYGTVNTISPTFGGGGFFVLNNFVIGGGGTWLVKSGSQNSTNSVDVKGGYGYCNAGYVVYSGRHSLLFPVIGIGGGGYDIVVTKKDPNGDFSTQLNSPEGMMSLSAGGWMMNAQLCYQYFFNRSALEGFFLGIRAGYKYAPYNWNSSLNDATVQNAPKINMNGFHLTLVLGGGNITRN